MIKNKELICIRCPMGCRLSVTLKEKEVMSVSGNTCKRGAEYAKTEITNPVRIVTSTVRMIDSEGGIVSVKTRTGIKKDEIFNCIKALKKVQIKAPVRIGDIIISDVAGTGVDVIATRCIKESTKVANCFTEK